MNEKNNNGGAGLFWLLLSCFCVGVASYMAVSGAEGWGWFLFVGVLVLMGLSA